MTKFKIYKLRFISPFHLGDERADYDTSLEVYHSDSMYAAIISVLAKVGFDIPDNGDLDFYISSLFPYYQKEENSKAVYFLPKIKKQDKFDSEIRKKVKKIQWLDLDFFNSSINGEELFDKSLNENSLHGAYFTKQEIDEEFITAEVNPRVTVSRTGEDARPFYMERLFFKGHSGMYFIATGEKLNILEKALNILKHEGIGTDRTVGNGFFKWESDVIDLELPESDYLSNLSMYIPESKGQLETMFADEKAAYHFQKRGGWITDAGLNTFRKNNIYMFGEGSVFKQRANNFEILGRTVDLKPQLDYEHLKKEKNIDEHPIWRSGKAIFIPVKI